jgi:hypothetical protein
MCLPPKVFYATEIEYRTHYEDTYCKRPIITFDGIRVYFRKNLFDHCMYESSKRNGVKDLFSRTRAERIDWIKATLNNPNSDLYFGWNNKKDSIDRNRRVAVVYEDFVVIIQVKKKQDGRIHKAEFVTAYQAENSISRIRAMPMWSI